MAFSLPELDFDYRLFMDKSTILIGPSNSGKSTVMIDILYHLKPHIDQILVFSPTDRQNHTYDKSVVPSPCIHYTITEQVLESFYERQQAFAAAYAKASKPEVIKRLFKRLPDSLQDEVYDILNQAYKVLQRHKRELEDADDPSAKAKISEMEAACKKFTSATIRKYIRDNSQQLMKLRLSKDEEFTLRHLDFNPRIVLIFDDCTDLLKKIKNNQILHKLFYQGRWQFITTLIACHTDKAIDPELKKNAFIIVFADETGARSYFERKSNDLDKDAKTRANLACKSAFTPTAQYQKLAWIRDEKKFYRFTAKKRSNFRFGSKIFWDYCNKLKANEDTLLASNKFVSDFS